MSTATAPPPTRLPAPRQAHSPYVEDRSLGVPAISLEPDPSLRAADPVDPAAARLLPAQACRHFRMIAVAAEDGKLTLAMADAGDALGREVARALARVPLEVVVAPPDQVDRAIDRAFAEGAAMIGVERAPAPGRLGGILVSRGLIGREELAAALDEQARSGGRLGEILIGRTGLSEAGLGEALADQLRVPLVDLDGLEPTAEALALLPESLQRRGRCLPLETDDDTLYVALADPLDNATYEAIRGLTDLQVRVHIALPGQLDRGLRRLHRNEHLRSARAELLARRPDESANRVFSGDQRLIGLLLVAAIAAGFVLAPATAAIVLCAVAAAIVVPAALWWTATALRGRAGRDRPSGRRLRFDGGEADAIDERLLPRYTVIVPVFDAAGAVPGMLASLASLAYPPAKLEVLLVARPGDRATIEAIESSDPAANVRLLPFADSRPGRVAAGCNYALQQASGRYVAIYGPGDRPPADQLKQALLAFEAAGDEVACVQAPLRCVSPGASGAVGTAAWFELLLPGMAAAGAALPLGPGAVHLDREALQASGGWDPFNSTPDAELGIRLHKDGRPAVLLDSPTPTACASPAGERAGGAAALWRGATQTYLVEMRNPAALAGGLGLRRFLSLQMLFGAIGAALLAPLLVAVVALWAAAGADLIGLEIPDLAAALAGGALIVALLALAVVATLAAAAAGAGAARGAPSAPFRAVALSAGAWRGLWQLLRRPFHP